MRTRTHKKQFWFNDVEEEALVEKSTLAGMNESDFVRCLILDYKLKAKPDEEFYSSIKLLRSISNNLNQIAAKAHSLGFIDELAYKREVDKMDAIIDDIKLNYLNSIPSNKVE